MLTIFRLTVLPVMILLSAMSYGQAHSSAFENLYTQIKKKNFFKAREIFAATQKKLPAEYQYFTEAVLDNAFNKPEKSNLKIEKLETGKAGLPDSLMLTIWRLKEDNCMKQYDYAGAKKAANATLDKYAHLLTEEEKDDVKNTLKIWTALENIPQQKVSINGDTRLKM